MSFAPRGIIGADHQEGGQLALRARGRLEGNRFKSANLFQLVLKLEYQLQSALHDFLVLKWMDLGKARKARGLFACLRIVFHGA